MRLLQQQPQPANSAARSVPSSTLLRLLGKCISEAKQTAPALRNLWRLVDAALSAHLLPALLVTLQDSQPEISRDGVVCVQFLGDALSALEVRHV